MSKSLLEIKNLYKSFTTDTGSKLLVLEDINLSIEQPSGKGLIHSFLAPFGSGKSTLLKTIAALEKLTSGEILLKGEIYNQPDGRISFIPGKPSSFPWFTVLENIRFTIENSKRKSDKSIIELIDIVGLTGYEEHIPHNKSIGFRFRISLARALAANPEIILLDEPFNQLDDATSREIYSLLNSVIETENILFILATTSISEAVALSDKVYLLSNNPCKIMKEIQIEKSDLAGKRKEIEEYLKEADIIMGVNFKI